MIPATGARCPVCLLAPATAEPRINAVDQQAETDREHPDVLADASSGRSWPDAAPWRMKAPVVMRPGRSRTLIDSFMVRKAAAVGWRIVLEQDGCVGRSTVEALHIGNEVCAAVRAVVEIHASSLAESRGDEVWDGLPSSEVQI